MSENKEPVVVHYLEFRYAHPSDKFTQPVAVCPIEVGWVSGTDIKSKVTCQDCLKIISEQAPK